MTIQEALKKAIDSGYKNDNVQALIYHLVDEPDLYFEQYGVPENHVSIDTLLLDPLFWQALGKEMMWGEIITDEDGIDHIHGLECETKLGQDIWLWQWHDFIDHLADDGTIEEYFEKL